MGNVLSLLRSGDRTPLRKGIVDNLSMTYEGNRLVRTEDVSVGSIVPGSMDFRDGADQAAEYSYDGNGNMIQKRR